MVFFSLVIFFIMSFCSEMIGRFEFCVGGRRWGLFFILRNSTIFVESLFRGEGGEEESYVFYLLLNN